MVTINFEDRMKPLLNALLAGDDSAARSAIDDAIRSGTDAVSLVTLLLAPAMRQIGEMWHAGKLGVAEEHRATQIAFNLLDKIRSTLPPALPIGARCVVCTVAGEDHLIGARFAADLLDQDGWDVDFLGANMPAEDLARFCRQQKVDLVLLSATGREVLPSAVVAIKQLRLLDDAPAIIFGGPATKYIDQDDQRFEGVYVTNDLAELRHIARLSIGKSIGNSLDEVLAAIGVRIQQVRKARGLSQKALAEAADLDRTYISSLERGKQNLSLGALLKISTALGSKLEDLMMLSGRTLNL